MMKVAWDIIQLFAVVFALGWMAGLGLELYFGAFTVLLGIDLKMTMGVIFVFWALVYMCYRMARRNML